MKHRILHLASTAAVASFAVGMAFVAPAYANPISGTSTTVEMPLPGQARSTAAGDSAYQPPPVTVAVQDGTGGVDPDGTNGIVDPDGTDGKITGPLMTATPAIRAAPAPLSPRVRS